MAEPTYERTTPDGRYRSYSPAAQLGRWQLHSGRVTEHNGRRVHITNDIYLTVGTEAEARAWVDAMPEREPGGFICYDGMTGPLSLYDGPPTAYTVGPDEAWFVMPRAK